MPDDEVERWLAESNLPLEPVTRRVREVILAADSRMTEYVKNRTLTFGYEGDCAGFVQNRDKKRVSLMFNRGAHIPSAFPHLEGDGPTARFMHFPDVAAVDAVADELRTVAVAWCELQASGGDA
ncbi:MAG: DUF1801 domain-containing protein [Chloroflexi bacterium]|nr:DUF1801 domain-containing protein [Chloroflexota bacterium]MDA1002208.1 DUF1801 domain-containing protein [Chloroflexota bacterium]MQC27973.1 DUF1801 domain-containing protein [Chloroflexota bacterium]